MNTSRIFTVIFPAVLLVFSSHPVQAETGVTRRETVHALFTEARH